MQKTSLSGHLKRSFHKAILREGGWNSWWYR